jgi:adenylate kinase family enzyme
MSVQVANQISDSLRQPDRFRKLHLEPAVEHMLARIRLKARCRAEWLHHLWSEEGELDRHQLITHAEVETLLVDKDSPEAEAQWLHSNSRLTDVFNETEQIEQAMAKDESSRLSMLCKIFSIENEDTDLLQTCLALRIDPSLARIFAYLQDQITRPYVTEDLIKRLFGYGRKSIWNSESPLRLWNLVYEKEVAPGEPALFTVDSMICHWVMGGSTLDPLLVGRAEIREPLPPLSNWPVREAVDLIGRHVSNEVGGRVRIVISGPSGSGRRTLAAVIAAEFGMPLLAIDSDRIPTDKWAKTYLHAQRQAFLDRTALCWSGSLMKKERWPTHVAPFPIQFIVLETGETVEQHPSLIAHRLEMPDLSLDERRQLWKRYVPESVAWRREDFEKLVSQHRVTLGEIATVARKQVQKVKDAESYVRDSAKYRLGDLAQLLECTFQWDDLILPERISEILKDFLYEARERTVFWEHDRVRRLFPQGRGLMALFSGPPGTGKTLSAQVIAAELGLDLFRIALSAVVSKYVGETSKNLERILSRAQRLDIVLLFDEADALLGKRTEIRDAHDRFANTDTNYLLQALEDYQGIAILSTNKKSNIDEGFIRRIRYVIEFPRPDDEHRFVLWKHLIRELAGKDILTKQGKLNKSLVEQIEMIAKTIELTGAQIKYAVLAAMFKARRQRSTLSLEHLLYGIDRELMKEGRVLTDRERERLKVNGS